MHTALLLLMGDNVHEQAIAYLIERVLYYSNVSSQCSGGSVVIIMCVRKQWCSQKWTMSPIPNCGGERTEDQ